jgi:ACR3 family arsenite efflux pump ArsB
MYSNGSNFDRTWWGTGNTAQFSYQFDVSDGPVCPSRNSIPAFISTVDAPVSFEDAAKPVALFPGIPLATAIKTQLTLRKLTITHWYDKAFVKYASAWSLVGLFLTILMLLASQGHQVVRRIISMGQVSTPLIVNLQSYSSSLC